MNLSEFENAQLVFKRLEKWRDLKNEAMSRKVDFVEHDRVRAFGRMQLTDSDNDDLRDHMMAAAIWWFDSKIAACHEELSKLGVEVPKPELDKPLYKRKEKS